MRSLVKSTVTVLDCVIGTTFVYNEADRLHLYSLRIPEADRKNLCKFGRLVATIASSSSLGIFGNDLLSSGLANQIRSRLQHRNGH